MHRETEPWSLLVAPPVRWLEENYRGLDEWKQRYIWKRYRTVVEQTAHKLFALIKFADGPCLPNPISRYNLVPAKFIEVSLVVNPYVPTEQSI